jgi:hypothetical protein
MAAANAQYRTRAATWSARVPVLERGAEDRCGERQERRGQQEQEVAPQQAGVDGPDPREQLVVVDPDDRHVPERGQVGQVAGPLLEQLGEHRTGLRRRMQLQHEQRDDDGEDPVAERLYASGLGRSSAVRRRRSGSEPHR